MVLIWLEPAKESLRAIRNYYKKEYSIKSAKKIVTQINSSVNLLKNFPEMASIEPLLVDEPLAYRSLVATRTYKVIYYVENNKIYIFDIWDCRQAPESNVKKIKE